MKAVDTFRHPDYRHNCAQAIAYRWHELFAEGMAVVGRYAPLVGGRAPQGMCGALYAAMQACPDQALGIKADFEAAIGAWRCADIKGVGRVPCQVCVSTADELVQRYSERAPH